MNNANDYSKLVFFSDEQKENFDKLNEYLKKHLLQKLENCSLEQIVKISFENIKSRIEELEQRVYLLESKNE